MDMPIDHISEQQAALAFSKQSIIFDELYSSNRIVRYKRNRVRKHLLQNLSPGSSVLELNAGTGEDAVFLARQGHYVHATDISPDMQHILREKVQDLGLTDFISNELCSYTALESLKDKGPYDCVFSNFAGLNCTGELQKVLNGFDKLLSPGGIVVLVILPKFCLWESLLVFKGKFRTATRRFFSEKGRRANVEGVAFTCWYYSPRYVIDVLQGKFELIGLEGLCSLVPPSYIDGFAEKYPAIFSFLCELEDRLKSHWIWKYIGDYYIISFRKRLQ
jgi:ubiquinone/menaquinone biosynthesis C-methylase UbiE